MGVLYSFILVMNHWFIMPAGTSRSPGENAFIVLFGFPQASFISLLGPGGPAMRSQRGRWERVKTSPIFRNKYLHLVPKTLPLL